MSHPARTALAALATATTAALLLAGCSTSSSGSGSAAFTSHPSGTVKAWGFNNTDDVGKARLAYAKKALDGVTVDLDQTGFDAQKFVTRVASGNVPDVVQMDAQLVATYAAKGLITPLDACYKAHGVDPDSTFYTSVRDDVSYDGKIWAVPQFFQPPAILLNMRVLKKAGVSADQIDTSKPDQLVAAATKMYRASGGTPTTLGFDPVASGQPGLWLLAYGGQIIDENGKPTLDDPGNVKGLEVLKRLYDAQGGYAKAKSFSDTFDTFGKDNQFVKDQVGAQVDNQWYLNVLTPYVKQVDLGAVPFRAADGKPITVASGTAFVIPAQAKNKDAACAWALSLDDEKAWDAAEQARLKTLAATPGSINTGLFTGLPKVDQKIHSSYVKSSGNAGFDQAISTYYDIVGSGRSIGTSPAGQQIQTELQNALQSALLGTKTPKAALAAAQKSAMQAYEQVTKDNGK
ncbi:ABC transporter substrate-binding protein [Gryllotalpicola ginsengisoli]|uniref:ABC transporter substrate-binding protein n=1 Tax=Gryllotalpicola ginsengisoli TaxID=444608 RepID=UPI0003B4479D|nr:extracellular solute-binding protein [Gryllotalpicola ginsengisoli]